MKWVVVNKETGRRVKHMGVFLTKKAGITALKKALEEYPEWVEKGFEVLPVDNLPS